MTDSFDDHLPFEVNAIRPSSLTRGPRAERISPGSRTWTSPRATSPIARISSLSPSHPLRG
jgi:hypothetical protein